MGLPGEMGYEELGERGHEGRGRRGNADRLSSQKSVIAAGVTGSGALALGDGGMEPGH